MHPIRDAATEEHGGHAGGLTGYPPPVIPCPSCASPAAADAFACSRCRAVLHDRSRLDLGAAVLLALGLLGVGLLLAVEYVVAPACVRIFEALGSALPQLTGLALARWFAPVPAVAALLALAAAVVLPRRRRHRTVALAGALALEIAGTIAILLALYLPIAHLGRMQP